MAVSVAVIQFVTVSVVVLAAIFTVLATAGNYWVKSDDFHVGLWKLCAKDECTSIDEGDALKATQTLMVITCICYGFALAYFILIKFIAKDLSIKFLAAILFATCILEIAGLSVYTDNTILSNGAHYAWSYALGWCSAILTFFAGILCFVESSYTQLE